MNRDIPIIFSAPMVLALLAGRKTMTRRLAWGKPMPGKYESTGGPLTPMLRPSPWQKVKPGDRLWVRENFFSKCGDLDHPECCRYAAGYDGMAGGKPRWTPSIHMPRWASRLTLVVTAVKIESLTSVTIGDVRREGLLPMTTDQNSLSADEDLSGQWEDLWDSLHGEGAYESGPAVVVISFDVHQRNIDTPKSA